MYLYSLLILTQLIVFANHLKKRTYLIGIFGSFVIAFFFYALRTPESGPDTIAYLEAIKNNDISGFEVGSAFLFSILGNTFHDNNETLILIALFLPTYLIFYKAARILFEGNAKLICLGISLSLVTYEYFDFYSNIIRNGLALSISLIAIAMYCRRGMSPVALILLVISITIHGSTIAIAIALLSLHFLVKNKVLLIKILLVFNITSLILLIIEPGFFIITNKIIESSAHVTLSNLEMFKRLSVTVTFSALGEKDTISDTSVFYRLSLLMILSLPFYIVYKGAKDRAISILGSVFLILLSGYLLFSSFTYAFRVLYLSLSLAPFIVVLGLSNKYITRVLFIAYSLLLCAVFNYKAQNVPYSWVFI